MIIKSLWRQGSRELSGTSVLSGVPQREVEMRMRLVKSIGASVTVASVLVIASQAVIASETAPAAPSSALQTPWGEPDLQGIWTDETDTPFQRSPTYVNQEFFTDAQRAEFDVQRSALRGRDDRAQRGSETDVAGAYNAVWGGRKRTGQRTSLI